MWATYKALFLLDQNAAAKRFELKASNTVNHYEWSINKNKNIEEALALEIEILEAWGTWYAEALESCQTYFVGESASSEYLSLKADYLAEIELMTEKSVANAKQIYIGMPINNGV